MLSPHATEFESIANDEFAAHEDYAAYALLSYRRNLSAR